MAPNGGESQEKNSRAESSGSSPDHSLVPAPSKRLLPAEEFFRFWHSIPKRERDAWFIAYVYRRFPICDVLQPLSEEELRLIQRKQKKAPESNCGKLSEPFDPAKWKEQVYAKWGAGDYQIRLNDTHPSVRGTVTETQIQGLRDWDNFPPIVNVEEVVLAEPLNQPYLRWARLKGIQFPGDPGFTQGEEREGDEDMAANATVEKLTDALIDATSRPPQQHQGPVVATAPDRSNEILADAAIKGQQILLDSIKAQSKAQDPMEFHKAVTEAARAMVPAPAASAGGSLAEIAQVVQLMMAPMIESNKLMLEEARNRAAAAERRAEALEQRLMQPPAAAAPVVPAVAPEVSNPVKNAIDLLKGLASLKDTAGSLLTETAADADMPVWARLTSKFLDAAPGMLHNAAVIRSGSGQPIPPDELNPALIEAENPSPQAQATAEPAKEDDVISEKRIAQEIAGPLIQALNDGRRGFEFAAGMMSQGRIMGFPGRVVYEMAVEQGENGMLRILQSYPELWTKLVQIPNQFGQFLREFLDRDAAYGVIAAAKGGAVVSPAPANGSPSNATAEPEPARVATPPVTVMPPEGPKRGSRAGGRTIVNPADGKPVHTAPAVVDLPPAS